jgi:hypothetical protein
MAKTEIPPIAIDLDGGTDIGAAIVDADLLLIDDGAGGTMRKTAASRIKTYIGSNTPVWDAYLSDDSDQSISDSTSTKIEFDAERIDTAGAFDVSTNYRFTVPSDGAGKYLIILQAKFSCSTANTVVGSSVTLKINGNTSHSTAYTGAGYISGTQYNILGNVMNLACIKDLSASDYLEGFAFIKVSSGTPKVQEGDDLATFFQGFKLTS